MKSYLDLGAPGAEQMKGHQATSQYRKNYHWHCNTVYRVLGHILLPRRQESGLSLVVTSSFFLLR